MITSVYPPFEFPRRGAHRRTGDHRDSSRDSGRVPDFPFSEASLTLTHLGRGAVWLALRALGLEGRRIAMPAYHCGSEVEAARVAGLEVAFYRVNSDLSVDVDHMRAIAGGCDALYLISFFGFPMPTEAALATDLPVIEDLAHGLFSLDAAGTPLGSQGAAAIFCPRKTLGVPDGGTLLMNVEGRVDEQNDARLMARSIASLAVGRLAATSAALINRPASWALSKISRTERAAASGEMTERVIGEWNLTEADLQAAAAAPSPLTEWALARVHGDEIRRLRRANYQVMAEALGPLVPAGFRLLPEGTCPLYLPTRVDDRSDALGRLWSRGLRAMEVWPISHPLLDTEEFAELSDLRESLIALPVHQLIADVASVAEIATEVLRPGG